MSPKDVVDLLVALFRFGRAQSNPVRKQAVRILQAFEAHGVAGTTGMHLHSDLSRNPSSCTACTGRTPLGSGLASPGDRRAGLFGPPVARAYRCNPWFRDCCCTACAQCLQRHRIECSSRSGMSGHEPQLRRACHELTPFGDRLVRAATQHRMRAIRAPDCGHRR